MEGGVKRGGFVRWFVTYIADSLGAVCASLGIGFGLGAFLRLPLIHTELAPGAASVAGSTVGALIGSGVAGILARLLMVSSDSQARRTAAQAIRPTYLAAVTLRDVLRAIPDALPADTTVAQDLAKELRATRDRSLAQLDFMKGSYQQIRYGRGLAIGDAIRALEEADTSINVIRQDLYDAANFDPVFHSVDSDWKPVLVNLTSKVIEALHQCLVLLGFPVDHQARIFYQLPAASDLQAPASTASPGAQPAKPLEDATGQADVTQPSTP